jgi:GDSL-like Lipase/Acylhydrolase
MMTQNRCLQKVQQEYKNQSFFCDLNGPGRRSDNVPTSVHRLTPGDIDVIGAIGDSLTAANGAFAIDSIQTTLEGRGVSWSIGGKDNWRKFVTLPNLIKEFSPNLYGYAEVANSLGFQKESKFNVAEPGAISGHTVRQAKNLVKRMRSDRNVDIQRHWKVITIMIGSNDFCLEICYHNNQDKEIEKARADMIRVLRILRENLPRTLVNVVVPVGNREN